MKRLLVFMAMIVSFLLISTVCVFAQGEEVLKEPSVFELMFVSVGALAAAVLPITEVIKNIFKAGGSWPQIISWFVSIGLAFVGWWLKLGIFVDLSFYWVALYGIGAGLIANGLFDTALIQTILKLFNKK